MLSASQFWLFLLLLYVLPYLSFADLSFIVVSHLLFALVCSLCRFMKFCFIGFCRYEYLLFIFAKGRSCLMPHHKKCRLKFRSLGVNLMIVRQCIYENALCILIQIRMILTSSKDLEPYHAFVWARIWDLSNSSYTHNFI